MPVIAMRVTTTAEHPNADTLRVYSFEASEHPTLQVVANQEHVYEVGEVAAVALVGTMLLDGMTIKRAKLRGIESLGMAMGPTDAAVGTDLSEGRCKPESTLSEGHLLKWTSIELLHNVAKDVRAKAELAGEPAPTITYRAKVKLHGTNSGVQILPSGIVAQGRNQILRPEQDNMGFATWVVANAPAFEALVQPERHLVLYGEWCGSGIQKGVAISGIGRKVFAVFAAQLGDHHRTTATLMTDPEALAELVPQHPDVFILPWYGAPVSVDFANLESAANTLNDLVELVEQSDPWVRDVFGVDGTGEGLVLYPQLETNNREEITSLIFKAKGEKHRVRKSKKAVEVDPKVAQSTEAFVATFVTDARMQQAVAEICAQDMSMRHVGDFLKWVGQDIRKESVDDLEAAGLEWKQVSKAVTAAAKVWFRAKL